MHTLWTLLPSPRLRAGLLLLFGALLLLLGVGARVLAAPTMPPDSLPNGVAAGDVTQTGAVLWARTDVTGVVTFTVASSVVASSTVASSVVLTRTVVDTTLPVTVTVTGLTPGSRVAYAVATADGTDMAGVFRTPAASGHPGLHFGVSGDWRGELSPYPALGNAAAAELDFFVALGDTIYADVPSPALPEPQAKTLDDFRRKHGEVYGTRHGLNTWADLRASTALFALVDDHEVTNDYAGGAPASSDDRFPETTGLINRTELYANGLQAFQEYNPVVVATWEDTGADVRMDGLPKLYRTRMFGDDAAIFLLDARSFRDEPIRALQSQVDIFRFLAEAFTPGRTMLGARQLDALKADLLAEDDHGVTWKFVLLPEPIQNLGPILAQDRFEGYAAERADLLAFIVDNTIANVVFIAADIHGTIVNNLTYQTGSGTPQLPTTALEVTTGSVAYDAPFGPTVVQLAAQAGLLSADQAAAYNALTSRAARDGFVRDLIDQVLGTLSYDPIGLAGAPVDATLLAGDYVAVHTFGWTEFEIDATTRQLTVTTWGIDPYTAADLATDPAGVTARTPEIVSQFSVMPADAGYAIFLPFVTQ